MAERIGMPPMLRGSTFDQISQIWNYLYKVAETMNRNLESVGGNELTNAERLVMNPVIGDDRPMTLKRMIVRTAEYAQANAAQQEKKIETAAAEVIYEDVSSLITTMPNVEANHSHNVIYAQRFGRLMLINWQVRIVSSGNISSNEILELPASCRPASLSRGTAYTVTTAESVRYCGIDYYALTTGAEEKTYVYLNGISNYAGKTVLGTLAYLLHTDPAGNLVT